MIDLKLSHYLIEDEIGRGGMGIVYRAMDTKLNRRVALKVLPASALASEDDRARFFREAQSAASLNHPNIATIYQIDEAIPENADGDKVHEGDGPRLFIAMELIEGDSLYDRIKKAPFPLKDAVSVAGQIAEALKEAHAKNIVHRDIKSQNVMITNEGVAKVLDFGLAKTNQSTMLTRMGSTLGTVAYMSPEQARGQEVDGRADLYSLGTVLYEMVAGRLPFGGDYEQAILYSILNEPPEPLTALRTGVPMELERITGKLLAKEADYRYQSAAGLLADLKALDLSGSRVTSGQHTAMHSAMRPAAASGAGSGFKSPVVIGAVVGALLLGAIGAWLAKPTPEAEVGPMVKAQLILPDAVSPLFPALMPDASVLYYLANDPRRIASYEMATGELGVVDGSDEAAAQIVSPDGRWVYFRKRNLERWYRAPTSGGPAAPVVGTEGARTTLGGFSAAGDFVFTDSTWRLTEIASDGSTSRFASEDTLATPSGLIHAIPAPGGRFTVFSSIRAGAAPLNAWVRKGDGEPRIVAPQTVVLAISPSGHLITRHEPPNGVPQSYAQPIDLRTGELAGAEVALGTWAFPSVSDNGVLVYQELNRDASQVVPSKLYRVTESGGIEPVADMPGITSSEFAISGDGNRVVVAAIADVGREPDVFLLNLERNTETRLTRDGGYDLPVWGPSEDVVYFDRQLDDGWAIFRRNANGTGNNVRIIPDVPDVGDHGFSPDGRLMAYNNADLDLFVYSFEADSSRLIIGGSTSFAKPDFSTDSRYLVFIRGNAWCGSVEVIAATGEGDPIQITDNGCFPKWTADGQFLYWEQNGTVSRVPVTTDPVFQQVGPPEIVYQGPAGYGPGSEGGFYFDLDDSGTVWVAFAESADVNGPIWAISNWSQYLEEVAPRD